VCRCNRGGGGRTAEVMVAERCVHDTSPSGPVKARTGNLGYVLFRREGLYAMCNKCIQVFGKCALTCV